VIKPPAVRRAEFIDCALRLFLEKGYERTTINDVIAAASVSKGAFYHHFRAKEDLLEAIAARFAEQSQARAEEVLQNPKLNALERLNAQLAMTREWKVEHLPQLRVFAMLMLPENEVLYLRIVNAVFAAIAPKFTMIIQQGIKEGVFDTFDARVVADLILSFGNGRLTLVMNAMTSARSGNAEGAAKMIFDRLKAEEAIIDRVLGLQKGSVQISGSMEYLKTLIVAWNGPPRA
jgi:AcrR family transcriptional regulator